jgi:hypothetical protein
MRPSIERSFVQAAKERLPPELYDAVWDEAFKGIGSRAYAEMIRALSAVDIGEGLLADWKARRIRLEEYLTGAVAFPARA